jgi:hypothetical protein
VDERPIHHREGGADPERQVMTSESPGSAITAEQQWRHRILGALLAGAAAESICQALPRQPGPYTEQQLNDCAAAHQRHEWTFGPATRAAIALVHHLTGGAGESAGPHVPDAPTAAWISPAGLRPGVSYAEIAACARQVAVAAGAGGLAGDVAVAQAVAVAVAARLPADRPIAVDEVVTRVGVHCSSPILRDTVQLVGALTRRAGRTSEVRGQFAMRVPLVGAFAAGLHGFLSHPDDWWSATRLALRQAPVGSGAAVMAATLAGARVGDQHAALGWGSRLRHSQQLWTAGDRLGALHPPPAAVAAQPPR